MKMNSKNTTNQVSNGIANFMAIVIVIGMFALPVSCIRSCNNENSEKEAREASKPDMTATAMKLTDGIIVRNKNNFDWVNATVRLGDGVFGVHRQDLGTIKAGASVTISYLNCVNSKNERFNPYRNAVGNVYIMSDNAKCVGF